MSGHETDHPELSERTRGWLRYMYRKALVNDDWSKEGRPSEMWDDKTMPPMANFHRFDAVDSSYAIALMSDVTPAWREVYSVILDRLVGRITSYWGAIDWTEQIGPDPKREEYPDAYFPALIPTALRGKYDSPGWAANGVEPWGYEPDPVKAAGAIYYKGFLSLTMGLHLYASGDKKYDEGFTVVNNGEHTFRYTHTRMDVCEVIVIVRQQFADAFPYSANVLQELLLLPVRELQSHINSDPTHKRGVLSR